jgi:hypothetical protein
MDATLQIRSLTLGTNLERSERMTTLVMGLNRLNTTPNV